MMFCSNCGSKMDLVGEGYLCPYCGRAFPPCPEYSGFIERFKLGEEIVHAGDGTMYMAEDTEDSNAPCTAIVTKMHPNQADSWRFDPLEPEIIAGLNHPTIPQFSYVYSSFGLRYLVRKGSLGTSLQYKGMGGTLPEEQAAAWVADMCMALQYAASQNTPVYHGNICPENVFLSEDGTIKLVGFMGEPYQRAMRCMRYAEELVEINKAGTGLQPELINQNPPCFEDDLTGIADLLWHLLTGKAGAKYPDSLRNTLTTLRSVSVRMEDTYQACRNHTYKSYGPLISNLQQIANPQTNLRPSDFDQATNATWECKRCGYENRAGDAFCSNCGSQMPSA